MKKSYTLLISLLISNFYLSQIGINTENPNTTLDVSVKKNGTNIDNSKTYGLQAPRLTRDELVNVSGTTSKYGVDQKGAIIYITDATNTGDTEGSSSQRVNITTEGYYYFDGHSWQNLKATEPWNVIANTDKAQATRNTENIYQTGRVLVGFPQDYMSSADAATYDVTKPEAKGSVLGQQFNVSNNFGVSRLSTAANMVMFQAGGNTWAAPTDTKNGNIIGNFLYEGYSDDRRAKSASPANFGQGRVGVAQVRATATSDFSDNLTSSARLELMTKRNGEGSVSTKMTVLGNGNVGIGTVTPINRLVITGAADPTTGTLVAGEVNRSGVRLDNVKEAAFLGTDANGDIIRVATPTFNVTSEQSGSYIILATDDFIRLKIIQPGSILTFPTTGISPGKKVYVSNIGSGTTEVTPLPLNPANKTIQAGTTATFIYLGGTGDGSWERVSG